MILFVSSLDKNLKIVFHQMKNESNKISLDTFSKFLNMRQEFPVLNSCINFRQLQENSKATTL